MNLFTAIKLALFGPNGSSVESIVKSFDAHRVALEKLAGRLTSHADAKQAQAAKLRDEAAAHAAEAERANRVANRVADLLR